jgi:hypothetical protein
VDDTVAAIERALEDPSARSATRRAVAADLFFEPGTATQRCVNALYEAIGLSAVGRTLNPEPRTLNPEPRTLNEPCTLNPEPRTPSPLPPPELSCRP